MRLVRHAPLVLALLGVPTCGTTEQVEPPAWIGTYSLVAENAVTCTETLDQTGRHCNCQPPGHYEGTITLTADANGNPAGTLTVMECKPGQPCGPSTNYTIGKFPKPAPPPGTTPPTYWLTFCAQSCIGGMLGSGAWEFRIPTEGVSLVGDYSHDDGNIRACGADLGPFVATRQ